MNTNKDTLYNIGKIVKDVSNKSEHVKQAGNNTIDVISKIRNQGAPDEVGEKVRYFYTDKVAIHNWFIIYWPLH